MAPGDKVKFWPQKRPLLNSSALAATVLSVSEDGETAQLDVQGPRGRFRTPAPVSEIATPGACTAESVMLGGEFDRSDKAKLEPKGKALLTHPPASAPAQEPAPVRPARGRSSAPAETGKTEGT